MFEAAEFKHLKTLIMYVHCILEGLSEDTIDFLNQTTNSLLSQSGWILYHYFEEYLGLTDQHQIGSARPITTTYRQSNTECRFYRYGQRDWQSVRNWIVEGQFISSISDC